MTGTTLALLRDNRVEVRTGADTFASVKVHCIGVPVAPTPEFTPRRTTPDQYLFLSCSPPRPSPEMATYRLVPRRRTPCRCVWVCSPHGQGEQVCEMGINAR